MDNEYSRQYYNMPELVKKFLVYFRNAVSDRNIFELQSLYEVSWPKLTEDYFEKRSWPGEAEVAAVVDEDQVCINLPSDNSDFFSDTTATPSFILDFI